jgi:hypothetical protein
MLILAIHQTPSLTQEKYEEVVRRLTGKSRIGISAPTKAASPPLTTTNEVAI